jgi:hypothetical protein
LSLNRYFASSRWRSQAKTAQWVNYANDPWAFGLSFIGLVTGKGRTKSPLFFNGAGYASLPLVPRIKRGDGAPSGASCSQYTRPCERVAPLGAPSQRLSGAGPRFLTFRFTLPPARSSRRLSGQPLLPSLGQAATARRQPAPGRGP